jgi:hypothetical protein
MCPPLLSPPSMLHNDSRSFSNKSCSPYRLERLYCSVTCAARKRKTPLRAPTTSRLSLPSLPGTVASRDWRNRRRRSSRASRWSSRAGRRRGRSSPRGCRDAWSRSGRPPAGRQGRGLLPGGCSERRRLPFQPGSSPQGSIRKLRGCDYDRGVGPSVRRDDPSAYLQPGA